MKLLQVNDVKMCSSLPQVRERHQCEETVQFRRHGIRERCRHGPDLSSTFLNPLRLKWFGYPVQSHDSVAFFPIGRRFRAPGPMIGSYQPETEQQIRKFVGFDTKPWRRYWADCNLQASVLLTDYLVGAE